MGFVENLILDFEVNYINCSITDYLDNDNSEEDIEYEENYDIEPYATFNYIVNNIYKRYTFDEKLKDVFFNK